MMQEREEEVTTIGGLAALVMQEFGAVRQEMKEGFEDADSHFKALTDQSDALEQVVAHLSNRVEQNTREVSGILHGQERRLTRVERKLGT